jgi:hypothetical protein
LNTSLPLTSGLTVTFSDVGVRCFVTVSFVGTTCGARATTTPFETIATPVTSKDEPALGQVSPTVAVSALGAIGTDSGWGGADAENVSVTVVGGAAATVAAVVVAVVVVSAVVVGVVSG